MLGASERHDLVGIDFGWMPSDPRAVTSRPCPPTPGQRHHLPLRRDEEVKPSTRAAWSSFARTVNEDLAALRLPAAQGNIMASKQPRPVPDLGWKSRFGDWIREPTPGAAQRLDLLRLRVLYGNERFGTPVAQLAQRRQGNTPSCA